MRYQWKYYCAVRPTKTLRAPVRSGVYTTNKTRHGVAILTGLSHVDARRDAAIVTEGQLVVSAISRVVRMQSAHVVLIHECVIVPLHEHLRDVHVPHVLTSAANVNQHEWPLDWQRYLCWSGAFRLLNARKLMIFWFIV